MLVVFVFNTYDFNAFVSHKDRIAEDNLFILRDNLRSRRNRLVIRERVKPTVNRRFINHYTVFLVKP